LAKSIYLFSVVAHLPIKSGTRSGLAADEPRKLSINLVLGPVFLTHRLAICARHLRWRIHR